MGFSRRMRPASSGAVMACHESTNLNATYLIDYTEIAASREKNHPAIASRSHQFSRIYAANSPATDLVVLGSFTIGLKGGNSVTLDFTARFVVAAGQGGEEDKFQYVQVWTDPTEMKAAFRKAEETLAKKG